MVWNADRRPDPAPNNAFTNEERRVAALRNWMD
jgi:hypothetical protein